LSAPAFAGGFRTQNFVVSADTAELAREIGERAECYRKQLALDWFGIELPSWEAPCLISAVVGERIALRGQTSYVFDRRQAKQWEMQVQGPREAILRSVLPHEMTHAIFATYFGCRLPRWAEEGACVFVEHRRERSDLERLLPNYLDLGKVLALEQMFTLREYPTDALTLYAQSYSLVSFLVKQGGKRKYIDFLADGMDKANWALAAQTHYGHATLPELQTAWIQWAALPVQTTVLMAAAAE
jgi:hypothetical protein